MTDVGASLEPPTSFDVDVETLLAVILRTMCWSVSLDCGAGSRFALKTMIIAAMFVGIPVMTLRQLVLVFARIGSLGAVLHVVLRVEANLHLIDK